ncbi:MAG: type II secretion system protein [Candidatus Manganitrophus sp.]|nr:type II secretion system protein [Candidatus Manganitrophus sp.]MDC4223497.1 type II secretion system protein [Candidatus Manganitrophus sp.]WDT70619.1 MAG: type II secretion system protein [Candidatus Manganitrophus sp.]WDT82122.1 MAG: type II secretion system protein [Candidatus Manganitrophus sp.]
MTNLRREQGFTLVEVVLIIVLLMILAAGAFPRAGNMAGTKAAAAARKLQSDIAYAQQLAMVQNQRYRVYFNTPPQTPASGYAVVNNADGDATWGEAGEFAIDPVTGGNLSVALNIGDYAGITISAVGFTGSYVEFSSLGVPSDGGAVWVAAKSVSVTGGGITRSVAVQHETGSVSLP